MKGLENAQAYINSCGPWAEALSLLRELLLSEGLEETLKWGIPVYCSAGKNVAGMAAFKSYTCLWFYQGALLKDEAVRLINAQEGKTRSLRQWRFQSADDIRKEGLLIRGYIAEAIRNAVNGDEIRPARNTPLEIPARLTACFDKDPLLKEAFDTLSLSAKRDYCEYIAAAKREKTGIERIGKIIPMILRGEGLNDRYKR